jgi:hypothetical protein
MNLFGLREGAGAADAGVTHDVAGGTGLSAVAASPVSVGPAVVAALSIMVGV